MSHRVKVNDVVLVVSRYIAFETVVLVLFLGFSHNIPGRLLAAYLADGPSPFPCNPCEAAVPNTQANSSASASSTRLIEIALRVGRPRTAPQIARNEPSRGGMSCSGVALHSGR